jgi:predicted permease
VNPPRLARTILRVLTPRADREHLLDDVDEAFEGMSDRPAAARTWYWRQAAGAAAVAVRRLVQRAGMRAFRGGAFWRGVRLDVIQAARSLARARGFTLLAVCSLGIGLGAATSLYGALRVVLLDDVALERPHELRMLFWAARADLPVSQQNSSGWGDPATKRAYRSNVSHPTFTALKQTNPDGVAGFNFLPSLTVEAPASPALSVSGLIVSGNAFRVLGIPMRAGRGLTDEDDGPDAMPVAVLTHAFWTRLGRDPGILGTTIRVNGSPFTVAGITAESFRGLSTGGRNTPLADVIVPLAAHPAVWAAESQSLLGATHVLWIRVMQRIDEPASEPARLGAMKARLTASLVETGVLSAREATEVEAVFRPGDRGVDPIAEGARTPMRALSAVVAAVLLVACVNLAALLLARGLGRQREVAIRQAIGAGRGRVIRQLLVESFMLSALGCALGLLLTVWIRPLIASMLSTGFGAPPAPLPVDSKTLVATGALTTLTALVSGLLPALRLTGGGLIDRLRQQMVAASAPRMTLARTLLVLQIAVSIPLLLSAALMLRSVQNLLRVDPGFDAAGLLIVRVDSAAALGQAADRRAPDAMKALLSRILDALEAIPGVDSATVVENPLLSGLSSSNRALIDGVNRSMYVNAVGPGFFETFGIRLVAGRAPGIDDVGGGADVAVINQTAARRYFGGDAPIGRRFTLGARELEVIGVAADSRYYSLRDDVPPTVFDAYLQRGAGRRLLNMVVRSRAARPALESAIRLAVAQVAPRAPVADIRSQGEYVTSLTGRERLLSTLLMVFGLFALALVSAGLYGVTSYAVARRTSEIGVRVALGARREQVLWMVLRSVLSVGAAGLFIGLLLAVWSGRLVEAFLFGLEPNDLPTIAIVAATLLTTTAGAALVPALRATRIDPLVALRRE